MPTKNQRLNISVNKELIFESLEQREDMALSNLATIREKEATKKSEKRISHKDAWK